jgi:cell division septum initiation protein DivIVA
VAANIDDILNRLAKLLDATTDSRVKEQLPAIIKDLKSYAQDQETERNKLQDALNQQKATIDQLTSTVATLQKTNADQANQIEELKKKLAGTESSATPLNLATSFKGVMDAIQAEARQTPGVATTVKSMDIEVKGLVQVSPDKATQLVLPAVGSAIDANALSTLRISFGAIPVASTPAPPSPAAAPPSPAPATPAAASDLAPPVITVPRKKRNTATRNARPTRARRGVRKRPK